MDIQETIIAQNHLVSTTLPNHTWSDINYKAHKNKHTKTHIVNTTHIKDLQNYKKLKGDTISAILLSMSKQDIRTYNSMFYTNIKLSQGKFHETHLLKKHMLATYFNRNVLSKTKFLNKKKHFIPVFTGEPDNHWKLVVIKPNKKQIKLQIYDSMAKDFVKDKSTETVLTPFLTKTYGYKVEVTKPYIKQQTDNKSCGYYTLAIATAIYHGVNPNCLTPNIVCKLRNYFVSSIIHNYMSKAEFMSYLEFGTRQHT